jgi:energy-converting hydrogenase Eha subunit B
MDDKPKNPYLVLAAACILPASGQVIMGQPHRGLIFLFFMVIFAWVGNRIMPDASFFARHAGAILVYGFAAIDAYKRARIDMAVWQHRHREGMA